MHSPRYQHCTSTELLWPVTVYQGTQTRYESNKVMNEVISYSCMSTSSAHLWNCPWDSRDSYDRLDHSCSTRVHCYADSEAGDSRDSCVRLDRSCSTHLPNAEEGRLWTWALGSPDSCVRPCRSCSTLCLLQTDHSDTLWPCVRLAHS